MPVFGPWVSPRHSVVWFGTKECIGDAKLMIRTKLQQLLTIVIAFTFSKVTKTVGPGFIVTTYTCVEVAQHNQVLLLWNSFDDGIQLAIEVILNVIRGHEGLGHIHLVDLLVHL